MAECDFCFENYAEYKCQFYIPRNFQYKFAKKNRNGKLILCECCDYLDGAESLPPLLVPPASDTNNVSDELSTGDDGATGANTDDYGTEENNSDEKRAKLDIVMRCDEDKETIKKIVQPGWYGKGYRKLFRRKRK